MNEAKKRSLAQNRYRFSVVVKAYQDWLNMAIDTHNEEYGTNLPYLSKRDADFYIKDVVWGLVKRVNKPFGTITIELPLRNADVSTFEGRMEQARAFAAQELHFEIALPHECIDDLEIQYKDNLSRFRKE